ncbi:MAG: quinonprotein alcohol dehydrogenase, partial [Methyloceanibacter sp.]|nr:quinonprotein alcohol dehydrogenase [Methyloceanibacter sp.]
MVSCKVSRVLAGALVLGFVGAISSQVWSADAGAPAAPVSQEQLNAAAGDESNFLHTNGSYTQTRY